MTTSVVDASPLVAAIRTAVTAQKLAFGEGKKPTVTVGSPYVVAFFDPGTINNRSLRSRDGWSMVGSFQCAGVIPDSVRFAVVRLRRAMLSLNGQEVDGRTVHMPEHLVALPMDRDDDADPPLFVQVDEWRFRLS